MSSAQHKTGTWTTLWLALLMAFAALLSGCGGTWSDGEEYGELSEELCSAVAVNATPAPPQNAGTSVTLTASGATCAGGETPEYRFVYIREGTTAAVQIRAYGTSPVATWNTTGLPSGA